jgi:hypothetical protein
MGDTNPNIQRVSFEEIQSSKTLTCLTLPGNRPMGDKFCQLMTLDHSLVSLYAAPGADGGNQNISLFYGSSL